MEIIDLTLLDDSDDEFVENQLPLSNVSLVEQHLDYVDMCVGLKRMSRVSEEDQRWTIRKRVRADIVPDPEVTNGVRVIDKTCQICYEGTEYCLSYNCSCSFTRVICVDCGLKLQCCIYCKSNMANKEKLWMFNYNRVFKRYKD